MREGETSGTKKARTEHADESENSDPDSEAVPSASSSRQRVTSKGQNVPQPVDTFEELRERFGVASHLLQNIAQVGYRIPTGIQSHGIPILLEVRTLCKTC